MDNKIEKINQLVQDYVDIEQQHEKILEGIQSDTEKQNEYVLLDASTRKNKISDERRKNRPYALPADISSAIKQEGLTTNAPKKESQLGVLENIDLDFLVSISKVSQEARSITSDIALLIKEYRDIEDLERKIIMEEQERQRRKQQEEQERIFREKQLELERQRRKQQEEQERIFREKQLELERQNLLRQEERDRLQAQKKQERQLQKQQEEQRKQRQRRLIAGLFLLIFICLSIPIFFFIKWSFSSAPSSPVEPTIDIPAIHTQVAMTKYAEFTQTAPVIPSVEIITPASISPPTPLPLDYMDGKNIKMRLIPEGTFEMGSNTGDELPIHTINLSNYYLDIYEVTNLRYRKCVEASECTEPVNILRYANTAYDYSPVVYVDWFQAKAYCEWRGGRLPTEAEWEKAARGTDGRTYPWGENVDCFRANYAGCVADVVIVGSYLSGVSPYGIHDMAGNVWEWTSDWYREDYYSDSNTGASNPQGPLDGDFRVVRGGAWNDDVIHVRSANRSMYNPVGSNHGLGFRCAVSP
jgi:formylglycine-generating enzyme required for sulfatase activity